ncbi:MAG: hypothetical protein ACP5JF_05570 [Candidatus Methanodesulfokora sp.]
MLSRVQWKIIDALRKSEKPIGVRRISYMTGCSISEIWRQIRKMERMNIVTRASYGSYRRYLLNYNNPIVEPLLRLLETSERYSWLMGRDIYSAIRQLEKYYITGLFSVKGLVLNLVIPRKFIIAVSRDEVGKAMTIREWFNGLYSIEIVEKCVEKSLFSQDIYGINMASLEQAIADSAAFFELDPMGNAEVLLLLLYRDLDFSLISKLTEMQEARYRIWFVMRLGRLMGMPLPSEDFKPKEKAGDPSFERMMTAAFLRLIRSGQISGDKGW